MDFVNKGTFRYFILFYNFLLRININRLKSTDLECKCNYVTRPKWLNGSNVTVSTLDFNPPLKSFSRSSLNQNRLPAESI